MLPSVPVLVLSLWLGSLPVTVSATDYPALENSSSPQLQRGLEEGLKELKLDRAVADGRLAVSVIDVSDPTQPRVAEVNANKMFYAASLPKIAILLGAIQKAYDGEIELDDDLRASLVRMIRHSSNKDASAVLALIGGEPYLAELLQSQPYQLYKPDRGGLWVGRPYNKGPVWQRDPLHNISHGATSHEVARYYYLLATDRLVSPGSCAVIREVLSKPAINHKFVSAFQSTYPNAKVLRKSGTWRTYHSDSALIERGDKRFIVVALANDASAGGWLKGIALLADQIVHAPALVQPVVEAGAG